MAASIRKLFRSATWEAKGTYEEVEALVSSAESLYEKKIKVRVMYYTIAGSLLLGGCLGDKQAELKELERKYEMERKNVKMEFNITRRLTEEDLVKVLEHFRLYTVQSLYKNRLYKLSEFQKVKMADLSKGDNNVADNNVADPFQVSPAPTTPTMIRAEIRFEKDRRAMLGYP